MSQPLSHGWPTWHRTGRLGIPGLVSSDGGLLHRDPQVISVMDTPESYLHDRSVVVTTHDIFLHHPSQEFKLLCYFHIKFCILINKPQMSFCYITWDVIATGRTRYVKKFTETPSIVSFSYKQVLPVAVNGIEDWPPAPCPPGGMAVGIYFWKFSKMGYRIEIEVLKDRRRRSEGVNVSQSKILYEENSAYTSKSTRHSSLLIRPRPHSYVLAQLYRGEIRVWGGAVCCLPLAAATSNPNGLSAH
jgi:hypothetical protein